MFQALASAEVRRSFVTRTSAVSVRCPDLNTDWNGSILFLDKYCCSWPNPPPSWRKQPQVTFPLQFIYFSQTKHLHVFPQQHMINHKLAYFSNTNCRILKSDKHFLNPKSLFSGFNQTLNNRFREWPYCILGACVCLRHCHCGLLCE